MRLEPVWLKHESVKRNWPAVHADVPVITRLEQLFGLDLFHGFSGSRKPI